MNVAPIAMASRRSPGAAPAKKSTNGILPAPISIAKKSNVDGGVAKIAVSKAASPRLKLVVRRLPPGLTRSEFEATLGDEWSVGRGMVDWCEYKAGKISKEYCGCHSPCLEHRVLHLTVPRSPQDHREHIFA